MNIDQEKNANETNRKKKKNRQVEWHLLHAVNRLYHKSKFVLNCLFFCAVDGRYTNSDYHARKTHCAKKYTGKKIAVHNLSGEQFSFNENRKKKIIRIEVAGKS